MTPPLDWWKQEAASFLNDTLAFINLSAARNDEVSRCDDLCKALNSTWNAFYRHRRTIGTLSDVEIKNEEQGKRADHQSLKALFLQGLTPEQATSLCMRDSVRRLATLTPLVMDHSILLTKRYDPLSISDDVRKDASVKHHELANAYSRFEQRPDAADLRDAVLKKLHVVLYIVRSNIAHSNKTPRGPDVAKATRDRLVSSVTSSVLSDLYEVLFNTPSRRLAVYGTLAPGHANASQLDAINGKWHDGTVQGIVSDRDGFMEFCWTTSSDRVSVKVLSAEGLPGEFGRLDRFEGPRYRRILVPVEIDGHPHVCNIYEAVGL
jgi:hypothetical protein